MKKIYDDTANDPMAWLLTADNNLIAADTLENAKQAALKAPRQSEPIMRTAWVSVMLRAFAVECLLKGIHVTGGGALSQSGKISGFPGKHDLVAMWKYVKLPALTPDQERVLTKLTDVSTSLGRYPVAMTWERNNPIPGGLVRQTWNTGEDQTLAALVHDLKSRLAPSIQPYSPQP